MGQRQSSQQEQQNEQQANQQAQEQQLNNNNNDQDSQTPRNNNNNTSRASTIRPPSRVQSQRDVLRSAVIPLNENQRRDGRRLRRERIREQQQINPDANSTATAALEASSTSISPFSRMIASVIGEAVITAFRNGHLPAATAAAPSTSTTTTPNTTGEENTNTTTEENNSDQNRNNSNVRQQLTMHLTPELFQELEPGSTEDSFMRFMRLPVIVTSVSTRPSTEAGETNNNADGGSTAAATPSSTAVNADGQAPTLSTEESEVTRVIMLPVFLYGLRSNNNNNVTATAAAAAAATTTTTDDDDTTMAEATTAATTTTTDDDPTQPIRPRRSARISAQQQPQEQQQATPATTITPTAPDGQWTVYIISGNHVGSIMNDRPSYEELLELASFIGPARQSTVSQEAIDNHVPFVKYTQQVKQTIVGNSDGCQVCLNSYQSQDHVRVLDCHHGFHKDCIDRWLTQGQNRCPLCRDVPIPTNN